MSLQILEKQLVTEYENRLSKVLKIESSDKRIKELKDLYEKFEKDERAVHLADSYSMGTFTANIRGLKKLDELEGKIYGNIVKEEGKSLGLSKRELQIRSIKQLTKYFSESIFSRLYIATSARKSRAEAWQGIERIVFTI